MTFRLLTVLTFLGLPAVMAQNLRVIAQTPTGTVSVNDSPSVPVQSDGREVPVVVSVSNISGTALLITQITVSGPSYTLLTRPPLPATLAPNDTLSFSIRYLPASGTSSNADVSVQYMLGATSATFAFTLVGNAPDYTFTLVSSDGRRTSVSSGAVLSFPATRLSSTSSLTLAIGNRGTAPGTITSVLSTGAQFVASLLGTRSIPVGGEVGVPVSFTPAVRGTATGSLSVTVGTTPVSFGLEGVGAAPDFVVSYTLRSDGNVVPLTNNGAVNFTATSANSTAMADVTITNRGNAPGNVLSVSLSGSSFQLSGLPLIPATVAAADSVKFSIVFSPRDLGSFSGQLQIVLEDRTITAAVRGSTAAPDFSLAYVDPTSRNTLPVAAGSTLNFPATVVGANTTFVVVVRNQGQGTGFLNKVAITGDAFQLQDLPVFPVSVDPTKDVRFSVQFTPKQRQLQTGSLRFDFSSGSIGISLAGSGIGPDLSYDSADPNSPPVPLQPNGSLSFSAPVGQTASKVVRITNMGNTEAQIAAITISGTGFALANVPFLPATIPVNGTQTFTVTFAPTQAGPVSGRLRVGDASFDLTGNGVAPRLEYSYTNQAGTTTVTEGGTVIFPPTRVGESAQTDVTVQNTGTSATTISTIDVTAGGSVFSVSTAVALPLNIDPGQSIRFSVRFAPDNVGNLTGTLRVNSSTFTLTGAGQQPVPLPAQRLEGPSGVQQPLQQPSVSLSLASPYSLPIKGTLTLSFTSDVFADNPAVQFSTGARTVNFTIPANTQRAVFENGATEVKYQTGTVAGTIQIAPTFRTTAGLDLTPASPATLQTTIGRAAPVLLTAEFSGRTVNTITLSVTGYATTRTLRQVNIQISPHGDQRFTTTTLNINVESAALVWFQSAASQGFGGLFSFTIPLNFQNGSTDDLVSSVGSLTVTAVNETGTSNSVTATP